MATWNLFVLYDEKENFVDGDVFCASLYQEIIRKCSKCRHNSAYHIKTEYKIIEIRPAVYT